MAGSALVQAIVLLPVVIAVLVLLTGRHRNLRDGISLVGGLLVACLVLLLVDKHQAGSTTPVFWGSPMPGLEVAFQAEPLGLLFAVVAGMLWPVTTLYAVGYMREHGEPRQTAFFAWFAIAISCTLGIALSANLFTLFIFYELLTLSTYPLVTHGRDEHAKQGGRTYLGWLLGVSVVFLMPAIIATWLAAGTLDFTVGGVLSGAVNEREAGVLLVLFVFGIGKAAIMPVHFWLPAAMVAPTPVSALLHAVAVVKAGVFTMLKVTGFIFGLDLLERIPLSDYLAWLAGVSILIASVIALREDNLKRRLAYSTVSQLSYITLAGLLANGTAYIGGVMHLVMHAVAKITLFFCAGAILVVAHKSRVSELPGLGRTMPVTMVAFFIASLGIVGVPPAGGTWSKWFLLTGTLESGQWQLAVIVMISSLLSIVYLLAIPVRAFLPVSGGSTGIRIESVSPMIIALALTAFLTLLLFLFPGPVYRLADAIDIPGGAHGG